MNASVSMVLELRSVSFTHRAASYSEEGAREGRPAGVREIGLGLRPGEMHALLGANGAGKSTLLQLLNGTLKPAAGEVLLAGVPIGQGRKAASCLRENVALLFHACEEQIFGATPLEDVALGLLNRGWSESEAFEAARSMLERLGLGGEAGQPVHALSHGQRRRTALAALLVTQPRVLALDEPTSGLDPRATALLMGELERCAREGVAVLFSTHDLALARDWAQTATLMAGGRIVARAPTEELLSARTLLTEAGLVCGLARRRNGPASVEPIMIVGAGPGDPELLTRKAARLIAEADLLLKDVLVPETLVKACGFGGEIVDVGRRCGGAESQELRQERIHQLMVTHQKLGRRVVRLKSGDPMMFGRAMEEARFLAEAGIPYEIVPGVTAGIAAASLACVPLTERGSAPSVLFCSGHGTEGPREETAAWVALLREGSTLVLYMGLRALGKVVPSLMEGLGGETIWVTALSRVSMPGQAVLCAPLAEIEERLEAAALPTPVVFILSRHAVPLAEAGMLVEEAIL